MPHTATHCNTLQRTRLIEALFVALPVHSRKHITHSFHFALQHSHLHTYAWVMSPVWVSHVTRVNASCCEHVTHSFHFALQHSHLHTYAWVVPNIQMSHAPHINKSCPTYKWVMSPIWVSHVTRVNASCCEHATHSLHFALWHSHLHTYAWVMPHT